MHGTRDTHTSTKKLRLLGFPKSEGGRRVWVAFAGLSLLCSAIAISMGAAALRNYQQQ